MVKRSYTIGYKLIVIEYAKQYGNKVAEWNFEPPPTEKMIQCWRKQEYLLKPALRKKRNLHKSTPNWPELEEEKKDWIVKE